MVFCSNETTPQELAVQFTMDLNAVLHVYEEDYYVYVNIPSVFIDDVQIMNDKVGMFARDYNTLMTIIMMTVTQSINDKFVKPYDFRTLDPKLMFFITSVFSHPRVSPFYMDSFLYLGVSYQFDFMASTKAEKMSVENRMMLEHGEKLGYIFDMTVAKF